MSDNLITSMITFKGLPDSWHVWCRGRSERSDGDVSLILRLLHRGNVGPVSMWAESQAASGPGKPTYQSI